jgi:hypothetical protein
LAAEGWSQIHVPRKLHALQFHLPTLDRMLRQGRPARIDERSPDGAGYILG